MKRSKVSALATTVLAGALVAALAAPASADFTPQPRDIVGGGSDTVQYAMNYLADGYGASSGYNFTANNRLVSFDAITVDGLTHNTITLKAGSTPITRPNGSTEGKALLFGSTNNANANYARSSSSLSQTEIDGGLWLVPYAKDGIELAVRAAGHNAPASISPANMVKIYDGTYTNWSQLGGTAGTIHAMIPQSGSGTRATFEAQLKAANGGTAVVLRSDIIETQEHDPAPIAADALAVAPFSTGRASLLPAGQISLVEGAGSWAYTRALYNVVRSADRTASWFGPIFGSGGFICGGGGKALIEAAGFQQLAGPFDGGVCGVPTQAATTNFAVN